VVTQVAGRPPGPPHYVFIGGSNAFVDIAADGALDLGLDAAMIKTERYGA
jgi:glycine betaine catabolism B